MGNYSENDVLGIEKLISTIVDCAFNVRRELYSGYLESVYKNALLHEFSLHKLKAEPEVPIIVKYKGETVGEFRADIIVEGKVIIELKAVLAINHSHETQLVNYLTATGIDHGIILNFGAEKLEVKRKYRIYSPSKK